MDMTQFSRSSPDNDGPDHLSALASSVTRLMCITSSAFAQDQDDHRADMMTLLTLISVEVLQHNHLPGDYAAVLAAWERNYEIVRDIFIEHRDNKG